LRFFENAASHLPGNNFSILQLVPAWRQHCLPATCLMARSPASIFLRACLKKHGHGQVIWD
jgi:hypothetical protein